MTEIRYRCEQRREPLWKRVVMAIVCAAAFAGIGALLIDSIIRNS